jgi:hypothetical protein
MSFLSFILFGLSEGAPIQRACIRRIQQVTQGYDTACVRHRAGPATPRTEVAACLCGNVDLVGLILDLLSRKRDPPSRWDIGRAPYRNHAFAIPRSNYAVNTNVDFAILDQQLPVMALYQFRWSACCAAMRFAVVNIANRMARDDGH